MFVRLHHSAVHKYHLFFWRFPYLSNQVTSPKRPLYLEDFDYMLNCKFGNGLHEKATITIDEYQVFWCWIGSALKRIRYQKHLLWLFESGYLAAFITGFVRFLNIIKHSSLKY